MNSQPALALIASRPVQGFRVFQKPQLKAGNNSGKSVQTRLFRLLLRHFFDITNHRKQLCNRELPQGLLNMLFSYSRRRMPEIAGRGHDAVLLLYSR